MNIIDHHGMLVNEKGHLEIGGVDTIELAKEFGTPLFVYDVEKIRNNCRAFLEPFKQRNVKAQVAYASKAFSSIAMLQVIRQEGLSLDVVSEGELYTALEAGFPVEKIHLHGNNKSAAEIEMAIENDIGCIVIDNFHDIELLSQLLEKHQTTMQALIRVTPGIESNTHEYIMTGNEDSKFGFNLENRQAEKAFQTIQKHERIKFKGIHCHIGSQIFETDGYVRAADLLFEELRHWKKTYEFFPEVINLGGGFGIRYTAEDDPQPHAAYVERMIDVVTHHVEDMGVPYPEIWIEPGRAIAGDAGITLYSIGATKEIPGIRTYVSIDGGMTDNLRPALYEAKYEGVIAERAMEQPTETVSIAGKCCESGDMLIWDLPVPVIEQGDTLAVFSTGAYGYSMANHYNRFPKPAVVFVENKKATLVVKRESYKDMIQNDLPYES